MSRESACGHHHLIFIYQVHTSVEEKIRFDSLSGFNGQLKLPRLVPMELIVEASPRRVYGNAHTYHVNSISVNSDQVTSEQISASEFSHFFHFAFLFLFMHLFC